MGKGSKEHQIRLLHKPSAHNQESGLFSHWVFKKRVFEPYCD